MTITKSDIARTAELNEKRTQGEWRTILNYEEMPSNPPVNWQPSAMGVQMNRAGGFTIHKDANRIANSEFIAHAPVMAEQVAELDRLVKECENVLERTIIAMSHLKAIKDPTEAHIEQWVRDGDKLLLPLITKIKQARGE